MNYSPRHGTLITGLSLLIGTACLVLACWFFDHPRVSPAARLISYGLLGVFFASYTAALWRYLSRRVRQRGVSPVSTPPHADASGTVYGLQPEREYQVRRSFTDFYGNTFEQGQRLYFRQRHFLPYDGGHTIVFAERPLYLQEDRNREVLDHFAEYIAEV